MGAEALPGHFIFVEWSTVVVTFVLMGSGLPGCLKMYKEKNTDNVPYILFLILVVVSALSLQYAMLIQNNVLLLINVVAVLVWGLYSAVYLLVTKEKMDILNDMYSGSALRSPCGWTRLTPINNTSTGALLRLFAIASIYVAHLYYLQTIPSKSILPTLGNYLTVWCIVAYVLPVGDIMTMINEKSSESCDMTLLAGGTLSAVVWFYYGYLLKDTAIYIPSVVSLIVNAAKFFVYFMYRTPTQHNNNKVIAQNGVDQSKKASKSKKEH